jgi:hypothetical protein
MGRLAEIGFGVAYEEALDKRESPIAVPCDAADIRPLGRLILPYGAHGIITPR